MGHGGKVLFQEKSPVLSVDCVPKGSRRTEESGRKEGGSPGNAYQSKDRILVHYEVKNVKA